MSMSQAKIGTIQSALLSASAIGGLLAFAWMIIASIISNWSKIIAFAASDLPFTIFVACGVIFFGAMCWVAMSR